MDYSQLSDFEINCEVLAVFEPDIHHMCLSGNKTCFYDCGPAGDGWHQIDVPDYCNDPSASWPIIEKYRISIINLDEDEWRARGVADCKSKRAIHENSLRAAMIVFLMMQDANNA